MDATDSIVLHSLPLPMEETLKILQSRVTAFSFLVSLSAWQKQNSNSIQAGAAAVAPSSIPALPKPWMLGCSVLFQLLHRPQKSDSLALGISQPCCSCCLEPGFSFCCFCQIGHTGLTAPTLPQLSKQPAALQLLHFGLSAAWLYFFCSCQSTGDSGISMAQSASCFPVTAAAVPACCYCYCCVSRSGYSTKIRQGKKKNAPRVFDLAQVCNTGEGKRRVYLSHLTR